MVALRVDYFKMNDKIFGQNIGGLKLLVHHPTYKCQNVKTIYNLLALTPNDHIP